MGIKDSLANLEKQYGKGTVIRMSEQPEIDIGAISTGCLPLDMALGIGGLPRGRVIEIFGPESSGKSTLALHVIAEAQKIGGQCVYVDVEHALDPVYAGNIGVSLEDLFVAQPDSGEQALDIALQLAESGDISVIVIDSVAALVPEAEIQGDMTDAHVGIQARLMGKAMRKLTPILSRTGTTCIFINQLREKIGVMFGNPETTSGGRALKFYASVRMDIRRIATIKTADEMIGNRTRVKVIKNKVAVPHKQAEFDIVYGRGISQEGCLIDVGITAGVVKKNGNWLSWGDLRWQGRDKAIKSLLDDPEVSTKLQLEIIDQLKDTHVK